MHHTGKNEASTLEGQIVKFADRIAYINHDIDDAIRANIINYDSLPNHIIKVLGKSGRERINNLIYAIINASENSDFICMEKRTQDAMMELRDFMFNNV